MKIVVDTSSLLSLEFMDILDDVVGIVEVCITDIVEGELKEIAGFSDEKSMVAKRILKHANNGNIKAFQVNNDSFSKYLSRDVDPGEASCLALCISEKIRFLITDDADAAYYLGRIAMQYGIELRICVAILIELIKSNMISKPDARQRLEMLIEKRGWEGGVLEVLVKRYLEDEPFVE
jgi:predicted nucleic acid-binding protein